MSRLVLRRHEMGVAGGVVDEPEREGVLAPHLVGVRHEPRTARAAVVGVRGGLVAHHHLVRLDPGELQVGQDEHLKLLAAGEGGVTLLLDLLVVTLDDPALLGRLGAVDVVLRDDAAQPRDLGDARVLVAEEEK